MHSSAWWEAKDTWIPSLVLQDPHSGRREPTPENCPLTPHMHQGTHAASQKLISEIIQICAPRTNCSYLSELNFDQSIKRDKSSVLTQRSNLRTFHLSLQRNAQLCCSEGPLTCLVGGWLGGGGKELGGAAAGGGLPAPPQSSGNGLGIAGRDEVLNCWSSSWRRLQGRRQTRVNMCHPNAS